LGNVYVAGIFNRYTGQVGDNIHSTTTFGSLTVQTAADGENDYAFFLAKYNNCGVVQWAAIGYTHSSNKVYVGLNPMDNSHVYVAGSFFSTDIDIVDGKGI